MAPGAVTVWGVGSLTAPMFPYAAPSHALRCAPMPSRPGGRRRPGARRVEGAGDEDDLRPGERPRRPAQQHVTGHAAGEATSGRKVSSSVPPRTAASVSRSSTTSSLSGDLCRRRRWPMAGVDHHVCGPLEVVAHELGLVLGQVEALHRGQHVPQPTVTHVGRHRIGDVPHAQPWVTALPAVCRRSAEVLLQEHPQATFGGLKVLLGIQRPQLGVARDPPVERLDEPLERRRPTDLLVDAHGGPPTGPLSGPSGGAWTPAVSRASLMRSRSSRWTARLSPGAHCAIVRMTIVAPVMDSTPRTVGGSTSRSSQSGSDPIASVTSRITETTRSTFSAYETGMSTMAVEYPWDRLPMRMISPLRTYQVTPFASRRRVIRRVTSSTVPIPSPASTTSPTPYWSSRIMEMRARKSLTRLGAPKPSAPPATPADARSGPRGMPTSAMTVRTVRVTTTRVTMLRSSDAMVSTRCRCRSLARPAADARTRPARLDSANLRADVDVVVTTTGSMSRCTSQRTRTARTMVTRIRAPSVTSQSCTCSRVTVAASRPPRTRGAVAVGASVAGIAFLGCQGSGDRVPVLHDQAAEGGVRLGVGVEPALGGREQLRLGQRPRVEAVDQAPDECVGPTLLHRVEHGVVATDEGPQQLGGRPRPGESVRHGVEHGVRQAGALDRGRPRLLLRLGRRLRGAGTRCPLPAGRGVLAGAFGVDLVGTGRTGGDEGGEQRPAHLEVDGEALEDLTAVQQPARVCRVVTRGDERSRRADELQLGVTLRLGGARQLPETVPVRSPGGLAVLRRGVGQHRRLELAQQRPQQRRVRLTGQCVEDEGREASGPHLRVAGHVPRGREERRAGERRREATWVRQRRRERPLVEADLGVGEVVVVDEQQVWLLLTDELRHVGAFTVDVELEAVGPVEDAVSRGIQPDRQPVGTRRHEARRRELLEDRGRDAATVVDGDHRAEGAYPSRLQPQLRPGPQVTS